MIKISKQDFMISLSQFGGSFMARKMKSAIVPFGRGQTKSKYRIVRVTRDTMTPFDATEKDALRRLEEIRDTSSSDFELEKFDPGTGWTELR